MFIDRRNVRYWLSEYIKTAILRAVRPPRRGRPTHVLFCLADHYEPYWNKADKNLARERVENWVGRYPDVATKHFDSNGCHPRHTFFYPLEEYDPVILNHLSDICHEGFGEVEIHLHHDNDCSRNLRLKLIEFKEILRSRHGLLSRDKRTGQTKYGFIHGNWALDNSRPDGRWCGVNDELTVLWETGCYADFTLPSAPSSTQTRKINAVYYAIDEPLVPKSHNWGVDAEAGCPKDEGLLLIQGPLGLNFFKRSKFGLPKIENGELSCENGPDAERIELWVRQRIHLKGREDVVFVKVYTHGAQERNMSMLLDKGLDQLYTLLESNWNDGDAYRLHYVTAREMFNIVKAIEEGEKGDPGLYRDYLLENE
jgi:hypothetical protein